MPLSKFSRWLFLLCFLSACNSNAKETLPPVITAKVIAVKDGDTIEVLYNGKPLRIRLAHIDCPEIRNNQPFGKDAKKLASELCYGQEVQVINEGEVDRYGRLIAVIINSSKQNLNKEMVRAGLAWHYKKYSDDSSYAMLELEARKNKRGIWKEKNATPPWEWRNGKKKKLEHEVELEEELTQ